MSAVLGDAGAGQDTGSAALGGADLGGDAPEQQQQSQEQVQEQVQEAGQPEKATPEVDPSKLDLAQPEHLKEFRNSYDKVKSERNQFAEERDQARQEIESIRATAGRGVYLSTDVPLEDFNPVEGLNRMAEEEPEYYEQVAQSFIANHFWPEFTEQMQNLGALDENDPAHAEQLDALGTAWDVMSRRMTNGQLDGPSLYNVLTVLENSPDLQQVILARVNGQQAGLSQQGEWQQQGYGQQPPQQAYGVQSEEQIAMQYGLDPAEPAHAQLIRERQLQQQQSLQVQREIAQRDMQLRQMQDRLDRVSLEQKKIGQGSVEEAERRAETKLNEQLEGALGNDISQRYGQAIPKDRPGLLNDIKIIAKASLDGNPDYKAATARAAKWFKQAAAASDGKDRDRWDKAGLDALAVVSVHRAKAVAEAAERLLGPVHKTVAKQNARTQQLQGGRREFTGGTPAPPAPRREPAPTGDIEATRAAIKRRWADAQGR